MRFSTRPSLSLYKLELLAIGGERTETCSTHETQWKNTWGMNKQNTQKQNDSKPVVDSCCVCLTCTCQPVPVWRSECCLCRASTPRRSRLHRGRSWFSLTLFLRCSAWKNCRTEEEQLFNTNTRFQVKQHELLLIHDPCALWYIINTRRAFIPLQRPNSPLMKPQLNSLDLDFYFNLHQITQSVP